MALIINETHPEEIDNFRFLNNADDEKTLKKASSKRKLKKAKDQSNLKKRESIQSLDSKLSGAVDPKKAAREKKNMLKLA